jgi:6-phosphofructokinase 2
LAEIPLTRIVTLTINPAVDVSTSVKKMVPFTKMRCAQAHRDPGEVESTWPGFSNGWASKQQPFTAGGATGKLLGTLVEREARSISSRQRTRRARISRF